MILTHWSWLYLPWFFPFVAFALLAPQADLRASPLKRPWRVEGVLLRRSYSRRRLGLLGLGEGTIVFVGAWALLRHGFYANPRVFDTFIYKNYGLQIRHGLVPYHLISPSSIRPGALAVFVAPTLAGIHYRLAFGWLMAACGVGCMAFAALCVPLVPRRRRSWPSRRSSWARSPQTLTSTSGPTSS